jgi:[ribosomal protein S18]-alanine N-acetyltransferase
VNESYTLRYMRSEDIPQVVELDRLSFPLPWSSRSYLFEITDNTASHMVTLEEAVAAAQPRGLLGVLRRLGTPSVAINVAGYAGMWLIDGEAHISTIAVHPNQRGRGLGEILLSGMLARCINLNAVISVLEVRVSNSNAIALYRKYEFDIVGRRKNYYRDNNEDAYLMHLTPIDAAYQMRLTQRISALEQRIQYIDCLSKQPDR